MEERRKLLAESLGLDAAHNPLLSQQVLDEETGNHMVENGIGGYGLPLGIGLNFQLNGKDYLVPMCVEEPSVVAAASNAAKMIRAGGGFVADADEPIMISQVQLTGVADTVHAKKRIEAHASEIVAA